MSPNGTAAAAGCADLRSGVDGSDTDRFGGRRLVEERGGLWHASGPRDAGVRAADAAITIWGPQVELELGPQGRRVAPVSDRGAGGWLEARLRALAQ